MTHLYIHVSYQIIDGSNHFDGRYQYDPFVLNAETTQSAPVLYRVDPCLSAAEIAAKRMERIARQGARLLPDFYFED